MVIWICRYSPIEMGGWSESILLGEHVGGSAVRSICFIPKIYTFGSQIHNTSNGCAYHTSANSNEDQLLLLSVGSKQVLTSWVLRNSTAENRDSKYLSDPSKFQFSSVSFQWLSTHMPQKFANSRKKVAKPIKLSEEGSCSEKTSIESDQISRLMSSECRKDKHDCTFVDQIDNDWRYLAVTAFLLKHVNSRSDDKDIFWFYYKSHAVCFLFSLLLNCSNPSLKEVKTRVYNFSLQQVYSMLHCGCLFWCNSYVKGSSFALSVVVCNFRPRALCPFISCLHDFF